MLILKIKCLSFIWIHKSVNFGCLFLFSGQISFYRETAYKHHMSSNSEYHRQLEEKAKNRKDESGPNLCTKCSLSFKVRLLLLFLVKIIKVHFYLLLIT
jgi:hypothetical protein